MNKNKKRKERLKKQRWDFVIEYEVDEKGTIEKIERSINKDKLVDFLSNAKSIYSAWKCVGFTYKSISQLIRQRAIAYSRNPEKEWNKNLSQLIQGVGIYGKLSLATGSSDTFMPSHSRVVWNYPMEVIESLPPHIDETNMVSMKASGDLWVEDLLTGVTSNENFVIDLVLKHSEKDDYNIDENACFMARQVASKVMFVFAGLVTLEEVELEEWSDDLDELRKDVDHIAKSLNVPTDELFRRNTLIEELAFVKFQKKFQPVAEKAIGEKFSGANPFWFEIAQYSQIVNGKPEVHFKKQDHLIPKSLAL
jgi:hypothetical protein